MIEKLEMQVEKVGLSGAPGCGPGGISLTKYVMM